MSVSVSVCVRVCVRVSARARVLVGGPVGVRKCAGRRQKRREGGGAPSDIPAGAGGPLRPSPLGFLGQRGNSEPVVCLLRLIPRGLPNESGVSKQMVKGEEVAQVSPGGL